MVPKHPEYQKGKQRERSHADRHSFPLFLTHKNPLKRKSRDSYSLIFPGRKKVFGEPNAGCNQLQPQYRNMSGKFLKRVKKKDQRKHDPHEEFQDWGGKTLFQIYFPDCHSQRFGRFADTDDRPCRTHRDKGS